MPSFDPHGVPILVNVRDRVTDLIAMTGRLEEMGYGEQIRLLDNDSTWPPAVQYLEECPYPVVRFKENLGSRCVWLADIYERNGWFIYSDPDIVPIAECPDDVIAHLHELLLRHREYPKAGLGIYIRDLANCRDIYRERLFHNAAENWLGDCHRAKVETTFALYRPGLPFSFEAVRSGYPYEARHLPFYRESQPTEEDRYYLAHALPSGLNPDGSATGGSDWARWALSSG